MMPPEVNNTLVECLQYTLTLRLDYAPAADAIEGTMMAWQTTFDNLPWAWDEERDSQRLKQAFATFWANAERFPTPRLIIDSLPPVPPPTVKLLPHKPTPEQMAANRNRLQQLLKILSKGKTL
ncbi:hypothetical protein [Conchiformibius steedae]|uniref:Uncharacterized protein n=1 Tax=Conchiformibius steedae TaxID=153493 RepID=A0A3P2A424_9NEIS|nr:hypothetical protein [Conchiformibius steedae]RRD90089.1 hypothetical protein EII21_06620 [Conchiformibius steedae]